MAWLCGTLHVENGCSIQLPSTKHSPGMTSASLPAMVTSVRLVRSARISAAAVRHNASAIGLASSGAITSSRAVPQLLGCCSAKVVAMLHVHVRARVHAWRGVAWRGMAWHDMAWREVACVCAYVCI